MLLNLQRPLAIPTQVVKANSFASTTRKAIKRGRPFQPPANLRCLLAGSGSDMMNEEVVANTVLSMLPTSPSKKHLQSVKVVYVGTASYDLNGPRQRQTEQFLKLGCVVKSLNVALSPLTPDDQILVNTADVLIFSGGNTLYAMDRWRLLGLDDLFRQAMERGVVLTGGSAGAVCWFQGAHSDSMDPKTWKGAMLSTFSKTGDESSEAPKDEDSAEAWPYIRIQGLGVLPGLVCPHHDKVQSNGSLRATDFDSMLLRYPNEVGICMDHFSALKIVGDSFRVLSLPDKDGSVLPNGDFSNDRKGRPGIWMKWVHNGKVRRRLCPSSGKLSELLLETTEVHTDPREEACRLQNPAQ